MAARSLFEGNSCLHLDCLDRPGGQEVNLDEIMLVDQEGHALYLSGFNDMEQVFGGLGKASSLVSVCLRGRTGRVLAHVV